MPGCVCKLISPNLSPSGIFVFANEQGKTNLGKDESYFTQIVIE